MRTSALYTFGVLFGASFAPQAFAWGAAGHEIVATIAEIHLHPSVLPILCDILGYDSESSSCHLAEVATWADRIRRTPGFGWSGALHYVGAKDDHPSQTCAFPGEHGWAGTRGHNVLGGIRNVTDLLEGAVGDGCLGGPDPLAEEALKFLVHFIGDMHQPLHLTGRDRGGNGNKVTFNGRVTNLHSVWDSFLIAQELRTIPRNYTRPLRSPSIERTLRGTIYDPYVRRIMWEGLMPERGAWYDEITSWLTCPRAAAPSTSSSTSLWARAQRVFGLATENPGAETDNDVVCPYHWASSIHSLNCEIAWPKELDDPKYQYAGLSDDGDSAHHEHSCLTAEEELALLRPPARGGHPKDPPHYLELDTPAYAGAIAKRRIVDRLLAMGGIRLAAILNWLFVEPEVLESERLLWVHM